jgi:hypothetical protein
VTLKQAMCVLSALGFLLGVGIMPDAAQAKSKSKSLALKPAFVKGLSGKSIKTQMKRDQTGGKSKGDMRGTGAASRSRR